MLRLQAGGHHGEQCAQQWLWLWLGAARLQQKKIAAVAVQKGGPVQRRPVQGRKGGVGVVLNIVLYLYIVCLKLALSGGSPHRAWIWVYSLKGDGYIDRQRWQSLLVYV